MEEILLEINLIVSIDSLKCLSRGGVFGNFSLYNSLNTYKIKHNKSENFT